MKIAFLNIYNGAIERGSEVFVKEMASRLSQKHTVCVFQSGKKGKENYQIKHIGGIPFRPFSRLYNFWVLIFTLKCLPILWKEKYDWIIPINGRWQSVFCRLLRFFRGGKILISGHAGIGFEDRVNITIGRPDIFVALTPNAHTWAKEISPKINTVLIPNGVDTDKFNPEVKPVKLALTKPIILCVSALLPYKRIDLLIKAVNRLPKVNLLVIGDGPQRNEIVRLGDKLLGDRFKLVTKVSHKEIVSYYATSQLFSLPSRETEAFGLVYLEAMACNLPIVAPDDINRKEIIGKAGLFCDPQNSSQYTDTLKKALSMDFGDIPTKQAKKYSWDQIAHQYEKLIG